MRNRSDSEPTWGRQAEKLSNQLSSQYKENLKEIARSLARFDSSERVLMSHVNQAHDTLSRHALSRNRWRWSNLELWMSGILLGGAFSLFTAGWNIPAITLLTIGTITATHAWTLKLR